VALACLQHAAVLPARAQASGDAAATGSPAQPLTLVRGGLGYMNLSFDTLVDMGWSSTPDVPGVLNLGDHDPAQRGFTLPNSEIVFEGAVDPYFKGLADIVFKLDAEGETGIELEETYLIATSLPWHLQLKAGQFFVEFGRQNPLHPHRWAFVDQPLVLNRLMGPDGLRSAGLQVSYLAPTPFYLELMLNLLNGNGETSWSFRNPEGGEFHGRETVTRTLRGPQDLLYVPRIAASFELPGSQTLLLGATAARGPNGAGPDTDTRIHGLDLYWKWRPAHAMRGFPFVSFQTEALTRRFEAGADPLNALPEQTLRDRGFYAEVLWGFRPRWVAGLRGESVGGNAPAFADDGVWRDDRTRLSSNVTWYPTEFSKLRIQYNHDRGEFVGSVNSVWLQMEFLLGSHGAHKF
jgi:hypothetical protein